jgi:hypothetical protein
MTLRAIRLLIAGVVAVAGLTATAAAKPRRHIAPRVLHLHFSSGGMATTVTTDGRYVVLGGPYPATAETPSTTTATLIDETTGTQTQVSYPGCSPVALGDPGLLFGGCAPNYGTTELYALPNGVWQTLNVGGIGWSPVAIGADWIELQESCEELSHCTNSYEFLSLQTGQSARDPTNAGTYADLNSPTLAQTVCKPLRVPKVAGDEGSVIYAAEPGSLTFYGKFAISAGGYGAPRFLERCGSRLHRQIGALVGGFPALGANSRLVVWQSGPRQLRGLFLPRLRRFVIPLPAKINTLDINGGTGFPGAIAASSRHLYLLNSSENAAYRRYWIAPLPSPAPTNK